MKSIIWDDIQESTIYWNKINHLNSREDIKIGPTRDWHVSSHQRHHCHITKGHYGHSTPMKGIMVITAYNPQCIPNTCDNSCSFHKRLDDNLGRKTFSSLNMTVLTLTPEGPLGDYSEILLTLSSTYRISWTTARRDLNYNRMRNTHNLNIFPILGKTNNTH